MVCFVFTKKSIIYSLREMQKTPIPFVIDESLLKLNSLHIQTRTTTGYLDALSSCLIKCKKSVK